jgi:hypothetical protein
VAPAPLAFVVIHQGTSAEDFEAVVDWSDHHPTMAVYAITRPPVPPLTDCATPLPPNYRMKRDGLGRRVSQG